MLLSATASKLLRVAFGPTMPGWGSWEWVGEDLLEPLGQSFRTSTFGCQEIPQGDVLCVIKHPLPEDVWKRLPARTQIIYAPIDHYGSWAEIEDDAEWLRRCSRIVVHCDRLQQYFRPYAPVVSLDHHVKYIRAKPRQQNEHGRLLWVGVRTNLPSLTEWLRSHELPRELVVLTNPENPADVTKPAKMGFAADAPVRIEVWSPSRHRHWLRRAAAALDIKGHDFRSRHKPAAKAIDFVAAGLPLAMNLESSSAEYLASLGFELVSPTNPDRWLSRQYWLETQRFGGALREMFSLQRVAHCWQRLIEEVAG